MNPYCDCGSCRDCYQREKTIAELADAGIVLPIDNSSAAWRRDYAERKIEHNPFEGVIIASVVSLVFWVPVLAYCFRKPILHFFGVNA